MSSKIVTNVAANTAVRYSAMASTKQSNFIAQLSSGLRVQRAADDASAYSIAARVRSDATALGQAAINAQTVQAVLNTAEGGYQQIMEVLQRMKAITTAARAGTLDAGAFTNLSKEYVALFNEVTSIATQTRFNGVSLLDGTGPAGTFSNGGAVVLLGANTGDTLTVATSNSTAATLGINGTAMANTADATARYALIDTAITTVAGYQSQGGADTSRISFRSQVIAVSFENAKAADAALTQADMAQVQTDFTSADVLAQAAIAALQKANSLPQQLLRLLQS